MDIYVLISFINCFLKLQFHNNTTSCYNNILPLTKYQSMDKSSATQDFDHSSLSKNNNQTTHVGYRSNLNGYDPDSYDNHDNQSQSGTFLYQESFENIKNGGYDEDLEIQHAYLSKLTKQRQKIEQLSEMYQQNQQKLSKVCKENQYLRQENERLSHFSVYYGKYEELKREYELIVQRLHISESEAEGVREQLELAIAKNNKMIQKMKYQLKKTKTEQQDKMNCLQEEINDKDDQIDKIVRELKSKQQSYCEQIADLSRQLRNLEQNIQNVKQENYKEKEKLAFQIRARDQQICQLKREIELRGRKIVQIKDQFSKIRHSMQEKEEQWKIGGDRLKSQIHTLNKELKQKENTINDLRQSGKRQQAKIHVLESKVQQLIVQMKKLQQLYETKLNTLQLQYDIEQEKWGKSNLQLRDSVRQLVDVKNQLLNENRGMMKQIKKNEEKQRQRKLMLKNQIKQINRLERVVERMI